MTRTLPPLPRSVPEARDLLRQCLEEWGLPEQLDDAQLTLSELVTNAVLHGMPPVRVDLSCAGHTLEIAVLDADPALPVVRPERRDLQQDLARLLDAEADLGEQVGERDPRLHVGDAGSVAGGRGLLLVEALASRWGAQPLPTGGKAVWLQLAVAQSWRPGDRCTCSDDPAADPLPSGGRAVHRQE